MVPELYKNTDAFVAIDSGVYRPMSVIISREAATIFPQLPEFQGALVADSRFVTADGSLAYRVSPSLVYSENTGAWPSFDDYLGVSRMTYDMYSPGLVLSQARSVIVRSSLDTQSTAAFTPGQSILNDLVTAFGQTLSFSSESRIWYVCSDVQSVKGTAVWQILTSTFGNQVILIEASTYDHWQQRAYSSRRDSE